MVKGAYFRPRALREARQSILYKKRLLDQTNPTLFLPDTKKKRNNK